MIYKQTTEAVYTPATHFLPNLYCKKAVLLLLLNPKFTVLLAFNGLL
ncbi:hypothetical protein HMPREF9144_2606 [Prevotella pallens ATCC 700821]|uniref:Uncharacterized protein n=1 Tax=Prevotella pallens ATCC 700821 TaxID=997353 RepID=F9DLR4_9BACT|nr:hypothetical protein HMPREF9144_2606 [Prevotella pallens ATCC 700821]